MCLISTSLLIVVLTLVVPLIYQNEIITTSQSLLNSVGKKWFDFIIFLVSVIISTPLAFPVWSYAVYGKLMGYDTIRIVVLVSAGSTLGSYLTYMAGRFFTESRFVEKMLPEFRNNSWTYGRSVWFISFILFGGTLLPLPIDVVYAICGAKRYPQILFCMLVLAGKIITYYVIVTGWDTMTSLFSVFIDFNIFF